MIGICVLLEIQRRQRLSSVAVRCIEGADRDRPTLRCVVAAGASEVVSEL